jgi:thiopeptide-type bacteriocin biosynthesis protein
VSLSEQQLIEPTVLNSVEFRHFSHPLARFLCEISRARAAVYMPFSWGAASSLPFLPRVRYGRAVLIPARWNLSASDLPPKSAPWSQWREGMVAWRWQFRLPGAVYLVEADNLLRLNLDQDMHVVLLRSHLDRHGHARLDEAPDLDAYGWLDGRAHEVVVPLTSTIPGPTPPPSPRTARIRAIGRDHGHLPGTSAWLYAKLYSPPDRHADLLAHVPDLFSGWDSPPEWWYIPYRDPEPHLRLRLHLPSADAYGPASHRLGAWAADLRNIGLLGRMQLDTYYPETGRYGFDEAMAAAEAAFAADSAVALAQKRMAVQAALPLDAITVAGLVDLTVSFAGTPTRGMRWLIDQLPRESAQVERALHDTTTRLADPRDDWAVLRAALGGESVLQVWHGRSRALTGYRERLATQRDPLSVLPSLLHMHHIRMLGIDPERERIGRRLARAAALRWTATTTRSPR